MSDIDDLEAEHSRLSVQHGEIEAAAYEGKRYWTSNDGTAYTIAEADHLTRAALFDVERKLEEAYRAAS